MLMLIVDHNKLWQGESSRYPAYSFVPGTLISRALPYIVARKQDLCRKRNLASMDGVMKRASHSCTCCCLSNIFDGCTN